MKKDQGGEDIRLEAHHPQDIFEGDRPGILTSMDSSSTHSPRRVPSQPSPKQEEVLQADAINVTSKKVTIISLFYRILPQTYLDGSNE